MGVFVEPVLTKYYQNFPLDLADVGASGGLTEHLKRAEKYIRVYGFEPHKESYDALVAAKKPNFRYFNTALSNESAEVDFHITRKPTASSVFKPDMSFRAPFQAPRELEIIKTVKLKTEKLDKVGRDNNVSNIDFMKLDTQGSELFILQGAEGYLRDSLFGIEVEVEFAPIYHEQPLFSDVDAYLRKMGFRLFNMGLVRWHRLNSSNKMPKGQLISADALYLKDPKQLAKNIDAYPSDDEKRAKIAKAITICLMYGHTDFALELLELKPNLFSAEETAGTKKFISKQAPKRWNFPEVRGRWWLARRLYRAWSIVESPFNRWNSFDNNLSRL